MTPANDLTNHIPNELSGRQQLDRLVDGELCEADRRSILTQLNREPDGWRRCAMAFLEAQSFKHDLGQIAGPSARSSTAPSVAVSRQSSAASMRRQYLATALAMAASFMIALALGLNLRNGGPLHGPGNSSLTTTVAKTPLPNTNASAANTKLPAVADRWQMVSLAAKNVGGETENFQVPAVERQTLDSGMLESSPGAMPPEVVRAFQRSGHNVTQRREIVPIQMNDGRQLVVPVDRVEIHFVGRPSL